MPGRPLQPPAFGTRKPHQGAARGTGRLFRRSWAAPRRREDRLPVAVENRFVDAHGCPLTTVVGKPYRRRAVVQMTVRERLAEVHWRGHVVPVCADSGHSAGNHQAAGFSTPPLFITSPENGRVSSKEELRGFAIISAKEPCRRCSEEEKSRVRPMTGGCAACCIRLAHV